MGEDLLTRIREIRKLEKPQLKSSTYLRAAYVDDYGDSQPVALRNYQIQGIMNLLIIERMILGDDTGLGKTLELLSTIGYIWLREPEYVPIVLTKKSALFQWGDECSRFMQGMEVVTAHGEPYERHKIYEEFFGNYDVNRKRLLILTYDMLVRDMTESVIRDKDQKVDPKLRKELKASRKAMVAAKEAVGNFKPDFQIRFTSRADDIQAHVMSRLKDEITSAPSEWLPEDELCLLKAIQLRGAFREWQTKTKELKDIVEPPKIASGIGYYANEFMVSHPEAKLMLVMDEMHVVKNHKSRFHEHTANLATQCQRAYGMTATPVKNRLMEFFALFRIIRPELFPKISHFMNDYCFTKLQSIGGGRKVPIVLGYKNLDHFVNKIEPFYLSRRKHDVAKELPQLVTRELRCELYDVQEELYDLAENGLLEKGADADTQQTEILKAMTLVQEAVDSPTLITDEETGEPFVGPSCKVDTLLEIFDEELDEVKVIIFSKFERMISLVEEELKKKKIKCVRITGAENAKAREKAKATFQNVNSGVNVILITMAGAESINLQSAEHFVFIDSPWSWGDYVQLVGRMIRIGSLHQMVVATHLIAVRRGGGKTIDEHIVKTLRSKKILSDKVSGESLKDGLQFVDSTKEVMDLFHMIRQGHLEREVASKEVTKLKAPKQKILKTKTRVATIKPGEAMIPTISLDDL
jgi:SNF2 family DNA or RNA helicase